MRKLTSWIGISTMLVGVAWATDHIQQLGYEAAKLRSLSYRPIASQVVTQKECATYVLGLLDKEMDPGHALKREAFLRHLGLLTGPRSMKQVYADLLADQVRGLYDPAKKRYLVVHAAPGSDGGVGAMASAAGLNIEDIYTVHELGHAIQDQHFNLVQIQKKVADNFDEELGAQCLIEGDPTVLMMDYAFHSIGMDPGDLGEAGMPAGMGGDEMMTMSSPAMAHAPRFFREVLTFPYAKGMAFVQSLRHKGGWKSVDAAFRSLPESSAQIIHPEKYGRAHPRSVTPARLPLDGTWKSLGKDTAGEFTIRVWAEENGAEADAVTGWGGDSYEVFSNSSRTTTVWDTEWDSDKDAARFDKLVVAALSKTRGQPALSTGTKVWTRGPLQSQCDRKGRHVQVVFDYPVKRT